MKKLRRVGRKFQILYYYYSVPQAGAQIGMSRATAYRAAETGDIPTEKIGKVMRVPRAEWDRIRRRLARAEASVLN
jgi:excisionase family DNA binding protein